ncbi:MAG: OmpA family protein [Pseudomonadota bacterium]
MRDPFRALALVAAVSSFTPDALAQEAADFALERLRPAMDREGINDVESGETGLHLDYDAALWLGYALNPLVLVRADADGNLERVGTLVGHRLGGNLVASVNLFDWVKLGLDLPFVLYQDRGGGLPRDLADLDALQPVGLGDLRLIPKVALLQQDWAAVNLALLLPFTLPTHIPGAAYLGDSFLTVAPELAISQNLGPFTWAGNLSYRWRPETTLIDLSVGQELGYRLGAAFRLHDVAALPMTLAASLNGSTPLLAPFQQLNQNPLELLFLVRYDLTPALELFGGTGTTLAAGFGAPDLRLVGGVRWAPRVRDRDGDGFKDREDGCPDEPEDRDGFEDSDGCPEPDNDRDGVLDGVDTCPLEPEDVDGFEDADGCPDPDNDQDTVLDAEDKCPRTAGLPEENGCPRHDRDGDGIVDKKDKCPEEAEDMDAFEDADGCPDLDNDKDDVPDVEDKCPLDPEDKDEFEDTDGCPDPDNDQDGILDPDDKCPLEKEVINGVEDEDGCPDKGRQIVIVTKEKIEITQQVYFDFGKATIEQRSHDLLKQVALTLKANAQISKIRIEGHTDDISSEEFNLELSQKRAEAVRDFLVAQGVEANRLEAQGFGESRPIDRRQTEAAREKNRRVEFNIVEINGQPAVSPEPLP